MSRRLRAFVALAIVSLAFAATACAGSPTAPRLNPSNHCDTTGSDVC